jgi:TPP-dependent pyruvate/acetoin dehydrogenase alpha subunit
MDWILKQWRAFWVSPETLLLRAENRRLKETNLALEEELEQSRKELRAAVNNLLSHAGAAPLPGAEEVKAPTGRIRHLTWQQRQRLYAVQTAPKPEEKVG